MSEITTTAGWRSCESLPLLENCGPSEHNVEIDSNREVPSIGLAHPDDYFMELSALSATGTLSVEEWQQLQAHLSLCANCRAIKAEYERVVSTILPAMASDRTETVDSHSSEQWSLEGAEAVLFARIELEDIKPDQPSSGPKPSSQWRLSWPSAFVAALVIACSY